MEGAGHLSIRACLDLSPDSPVKPLQAWPTVRFLQPALYPGQPAPTDW